MFRRRKETGIEKLVRDMNHMAKHAKDTWPRCDMLTCKNKIDPIYAKTCAYCSDCCGDD